MSGRSFRPMHRLRSIIVAPLALSVASAAATSLPAPGRALHRARVADVGVNRPPLASPDSVEVVGAVERLRAALAAGDSATVIAMLAPDAVILESGDAETRAQYQRHHLPADIQFARAIRGTHTLVSAVVHGDAAWVSSTSLARGRFRGRMVNSAGAELVVLARRDARSPWQIRAIHWSSHRRAQ